MNRNECINCKYYEKCGKPSRPVKCMGYELKEAAVKSRTLSGMKPIKPQKCKFDSIDCTPTCRYYKTCVHSLHKQAVSLHI